MAQRGRYLHSFKIISLKSFLEFFIEFKIYFFSRISSQYRKLTLNQQKDMDVRTISIVHGIFTCFEIPMFIYASKEQAADLYGYSSTISQTVIAFSLGTFRSAHRRLGKLTHSHTHTHTQTSSSLNELIR